MRVYTRTGEMMSREFRLTLSQTYHGVNCNNVFFYTSSSNLPTQADELTGGFIDDVLDDILAIQNSDVTTVSVSAIDLNFGIDYDTTFNSDPGDVGDHNSGLNAQDAWLFTYSTTASVIRHGYKRFVGIDEASVAAGEAVAGMATSLNSLAATLKSNVTFSTYTFIPILVRFTTAHPPTVSLFTPITDCDYRRVSHQNTRRQ